MSDKKRLTPDVSSNANFHEVSVFDFHLELAVNFEQRKIRGTVDLSFHVLNPEYKQVVLDTNMLHISKVSMVGSSGEHTVLPFRLDENKPIFGAALRIDRPADAGRHFTLKISFETSENAPSLCWLEPSQTADTPSVRSTYSANVTVPKDFVALTSARHRFGPRPASEHEHTFSFRMPFPIPVYLVALAVGELVSAPISPRSSVWTEPSMLEAAQREFQGVTEKYLSVGEKLFGKYEWGIYDVLVMPPSFPWGGMENACLTFVSPTLITGDGSLTNILAHEISHSWFGNLVTNCNWTHFFLNEGLTTYAERRLVGAVHGRDQEGLQASVGIATLRKEIAALGDTNLLTALNPPLEGIDPDDTYNACPYEKGYAFVCYLRGLVGDPAEQVSTASTDDGLVRTVFDEFLAAYVQRFKFCSIATHDFMEFFFEKFPQLRATVEPELASWITAPGLPPVLPDHTAHNNRLIRQAEELADAWIAMAATGRAFSEVISEYDVSAWPTYQKSCFLDQLYAVPAGTLTEPILRQLHERYGFGASTNGEVRLRWAVLAIKNGYWEALPSVKEFLRMQAKQKYVVPIYRELIAAGPQGVAVANEMFEETKPGLHVLLRGILSRLLSSTRT